MNSTIQSAMYLRRNKTHEKIEQPLSVLVKGNNSTPTHERKDKRTTNKRGRKVVVEVDEFGEVDRS